MNNLINYNKPCKDTLGRLKRMYLAKFIDYDDSQIITNAGVLDTFPDTVIFKFDVFGSYTQTSESKGGAVGWTQDITVNLDKVYNVLNPAIFTNQKFRLIGETNNGIYLIFGLFNGLDCSLSNNSGEDKAAFNGFALSLSGMEEEAAMITDINNFYIFDESLYFNYNFNFDIVSNMDTQFNYELNLNI